MPFKYQEIPVLTNFVALKGSIITPLELFLLGVTDTSATSAIFNKVTINTVDSLHINRSLFV